MLSSPAFVGPYPILDLNAYEKVRAHHRPAVLNCKKNRRVFVGPYAVFLFENAYTLWWQIQEMLRIEKGGATQLADELEAYGPLVPQINTWVATLMFEIDDAVQRRAILQQLGHIESHITLFGEHNRKMIRIAAVPADTSVRTTPLGKTSAVHFLRFVSSQGEGSFVPMGIEMTHPHYHHTTEFPFAVQRALAADWQPQ